MSNQTAVQDPAVVIKTLLDQVSAELDKRDAAQNEVRTAELKAMRDDLEKIKAQHAAYSLPGSATEKHKGESYSFRKAIRAVMTNDWSVAPLEKAMSDEVKTKAMSFGVDTAGGFLVPSEVMVGEIIPRLYAESTVKAMGAREWTGMTRAPLYVPRIGGGVTAQWLGEGATGTASDLRVEQMKLEPHKLMAITVMSEELLALENASVENQIRDDMALAFAEKLDLAALNGGGGAEPVGVFQYPGVSTSTLTDPSTYNELLAFISTVRGNNALKGNPGWIISNADMLEIEQMIDTDSGGSNTRSQVHERRRLLSEDGSRLLGYPVAVSTQLADGRVAFGNWSDLVIAQWGGMSIAYTNAVGFMSGQAHVRMISMFDIGIRQPKSFCIPA